MIAREWKATCPKAYAEDFIAYLYQTGIKDTSATKGFKGAQIFNREIDQKIEITLISYWDNLECIKAFAGEDINIAKLYPEDDTFKLEPDHHVIHYEVCENMWV